MTIHTNYELVEAFTIIQKKLIPLIKLEDNFRIDEINFIAGVDLAYWNDGNNLFAVCCIVVIDYKTKQIVETVSERGQIHVPYISGFLAFRELPLILLTAKKLHTTPDLYMFDGNGYLHEQHMGIATHAAICLKKPTIGIAKSYLKINNVDFKLPDNNKGAYTNIIINNLVYGRALRSRVNVKPIFLSCGNWIRLETATKIVMNLIDTSSRLPIPIRYADLCTRKLRRNFKNEN